LQRQVTIDPEYEAIMPRLSKEEYEILKASIKTDGQFVPIIVNENGIILDGHHRFKACLELGLQPQLEVKKFTDRESERDFVIRVNWARRHLSREQQQELALTLRQNGWTQQTVSELLKVDRTTITKWEMNITNVKNHNGNNSALDLRYSIPDQAKQTIYERHVAGETQQVIASDFKISQPRVSAIVRQIEARKRVPEVAKSPAFPNKRYDCIVIDPPWPVEKIEREVRPKQGLELDYPVMSLQKISDLPILSLTNPNGCHVYLWATNKFLPVALQFFIKWGIKYQCTLAWVKNVGITPFSFMYNLEFVLFGRVGNLPLTECGVKQSFEGAEGLKANSTNHSEKPDAFYELVSKVSPEPRLDMFARKPRVGFDVWGNEVKP
jgi:N6-adenosine-specific RNA methylase IME4/predicted XRE-type DNA-binding protein